MTRSHQNSPFVSSSHSPAAVSPIGAFGNRLTASPVLQPVDILREKLSLEIKKMNPTSTDVNCCSRSVPSHLDPVLPLAITPISWADVVANSSKNKLLFHPLELRNGTLVVKVPHSIHEEGVFSKQALKQEWKVVSGKGKKPQEDKDSTALAESGDTQTLLPSKDIQMIQSPPIPTTQPSHQASLLRENVNENPFAILTQSVSNSVLDVGQVVAPRSRVTSQGVAIVDLVLMSKALPSVRWIVSGGFNEIRAIHERSDWHSLACLPIGLEVFHNSLNEAELDDLPTIDPINTWSNKRFQGLIAKKLDRLMVNEAWVDAYPNTKARFLAPRCSDHNIGFVEIATPIGGTRRKPFKFFSF
ncbi:hypothetical protein SLEP1_g25024 [Rubroshorea leprosula]|uniref:Endonuclease/exonuclease/phosphatase domain-containing protein n=1 Tax=Rubroshorea leprosula TaxID=152421 RepID=A0AAV5JS23_9ROSI|nr:hypothetical protein SLEP1_g25024 [Rubroshorea leprosula]